PEDAQGRRGTPGDYPARRRPVGLVEPGQGTTAEAHPGAGTPPGRVVRVLRRGPRRFRGEAAGPPGRVGRTPTRPGAGRLPAVLALWHHLWGRQTQPWWPSGGVRQPQRQAHRPHRPRPRRQGPGRRSQVEKVVGPWPIRQALRCGGEEVGVVAFGEVL